MARRAFLRRLRREIMKGVALWKNALTPVSSTGQALTLSLSERELYSLFRAFGGYNHRSQIPLQVEVTP